MTVARHALADAWRLLADSRARLLHLPVRHFEACQDVDHALTLLLGERQLITRWMRRRHVHLFHARPLDIVLGSAAGCCQVRSMLLAELADADPSNGIVAMAMELPR